MAEKITNAYNLRYFTGAPLARIRKATLFFFALLFSIHVSAQNDEPPYDEISVTIEVKGIGTIESPALYSEPDVYLPVTTLFDFIKIRNVPSQSSDTIKGFFINEQDAFLIDGKTKRVFFKGQTYDLNPKGLIKSGTGLFMELKYFKKIFGLDGVFSFRRLVVTLSADFELPATREMKQEQMRRNVSRLQGNTRADTNIRRSYPFFHFGMADWAVLSSQQSEGADQTTLNLGLGAVLAGGELNASLNYYSQQAFIEKLQYYQWRYVNNDNEALRQVVAGKIFAQATATLYAPLVGIQFTNAPTIYRKSYGTYRLSNVTQPGWTVELYVNDVLIDYKKADASGQYTFEVPLFYGYTIIKLRFFGPYGEERTSQQYINIPFNFLPLHELEYSASGGVVEDGKNSRFARVRLNYGLSKSITIGGGVEYLSSVTSGSTMPFVNTSIRLSSRLLLSGEYTYSVKSRGVLSYRLPAGVQLDVDYTKYDKGQTAIFYNYLEERKATITVPVYHQGLSVLSRLTLDQVVVPETKYTNAEWVITGFVKRVGVNLSTYASFVKQDIPYIYTIVGLTLPVPGHFILSPQVQYDYKSNDLVFAKFNLERRVTEKGYINLQFQDYFVSNNVNFLVGIRYDFAPTKVALSVLQGNNNTYSRVEAASGSLIVDRKTSYCNLNNRANVGRAGMVVAPYLDLNNNGRRDPGEPRVPGLKLRVNGGRIVYDDDDTCIRVLDLEPYNNYLVELDANSFDVVSWQIRNKVLGVTPNANSFTLIEAPVKVVGEVSGTVSAKGKIAKGQGQIIVDIYSDTNLVARAVTESDGFFNYLGLAPGAYTVRVDSDQLHKLHLQALPASQPVKIAMLREGDVADGVDFVLQPAQPDTGAAASIVVHQPPAKPGTRHDTLTQVVGAKGSYAILVDVSDNINKAGREKSRLLRALKLQDPLAMRIVQTGDDYKLEITGFKKRKDAEACLPRVESSGFKEALVIRLKDEVVK